MKILYIESSVNLSLKRVKNKMYFRCRYLTKTLQKSGHIGYLKFSVLRRELEELLHGPRVTDRHDDLVGVNVLDSLLTESK